MRKGVKFLIIGFVLSLPFWWGVSFWQGELEQIFYAQISQPLKEITLVKIPILPQKPELNLQAKSALAIRISETGKKKILFSKNSERILPIASLTKLMSAILVLENTPKGDYDLEKVITISSKAAAQENVPVYGNLKAEETFTIEKLLELMLIYSSNDAAFALSEVVGLEDFVKEMNQKTKDLELKNTYFTNSTGLDPKNQEQTLNYSTSQDLIKLTQYILENYSLVFEISSKRGPYLLENGFSDLSLPEGQEIVGGKTGYTSTAGGCMLLVLKNEKGSFFINVILGTVSPLTRVKEMQKLIDWLEL